MQKQREGDEDARGRGREEGLGLSKKWGVSVQEIKRLGYLAGPLIVANFSQYFLQVISIMMVGHLDQLSLSSTAIAVSLSAVSGFSLLVISLILLFVLFNFLC